MEGFDGVVVPGGVRGLQILEALEAQWPGMSGQVTLSERVSEQGYDIECSWVDGPTSLQAGAALEGYSAALVGRGEELVVDPGRVLLLRTLTLTGVTAAILAGRPRCMLVHSPALTRSEHAEVEIEAQLPEARRILEVALALEPQQPSYLRIVRRHAEDLRFDHIPDATRIWLMREGIELAQAALCT